MPLWEHLSGMSRMVSSLTKASLRTPTASLLALLITLREKSLKVMTPSAPEFVNRYQYHTKQLYL